MQVKYVADDGSEFPNEQMCKGYEALIRTKERHGKSDFRHLVEGLFANCTTRDFSCNRDPNDPGENVFNVDRNMEKFIANLVRNLPALQEKFEKAMHDVSRA